MASWYVWSGSLRGVRVDAISDACTPAEAVSSAIHNHLPCVLGGAIRVSKHPRGLHSDDTYFEPPYESRFPHLFTGEFDIQVSYITKRG